MSLASWKREFYPVEADKVTAFEEAVDHCIKKWEGALPENLAKHGVFDNGCGDIVGSDDDFCFDAITCALCQVSKRRATEFDFCAPCPLYQARGGVSCTETTGDEEISPLNAFCDPDDGESDPRPMLVQLRKAKEWMAEQAKKVQP